MNNRILASAIAIAFLAGIPSGIFAAENPQDPPERLNVLFIAADDLRNNLGCYGHPLVKTPNLDRLAQRGIVFDRAYCQQALCNPSRASLMTGRRPDRLGIWNLSTHFRESAPDVVTLPQWFQHQGYFTQNIGKIFHNWRQEIQGDPTSWCVPAVMHYGTHGSDKPQVEGDQLPPDQTRHGRNECRDVPDEAYFDGRIAAAAVEALQACSKRKQPFFLAIGFWKPHLPFNAPQKYWDLYDRESITAAGNPHPPTDVPEIALHNGRELLGDNGRELSADEVLELRHGYLACISYLDAQVGKLLDELDRLDLTRRTVIVFWSDHGFHLGEHSLWCKTSNFELDARVPLIIAPPDLPTAGTRSSALVELLDLYPTLVDLCDLPERDDLDGQSLVPLLRDPSATVKPAAFTQHPRPAYYKGRPEVMGVSARTDRFRYTEWRDFQSGDVVARELYDHQEDPDENHNVISTPPDQNAFDAAVAQLEETFPRKGYPESRAVKPAEDFDLQPLKHGVADLTVDLGVGLWAWPLPIDWDADGDLDLVVACPDVPYRGIYLFENPGGDDKLPVFKRPRLVGAGTGNISVSYVDGKPRVLVPGYELTDFRGTEFGQRTKLYPRTSVHPNRVRANQWKYVDYDGDGALDLVVGVGDWTDYGWDNAFDRQGNWTRGPLRGFVYLIRNQGTTGEPDYAEPEKLSANGKPIEVFGMPSPNFADFDSDGDLDLLCGEFLDGFTYFENDGSRTEPRYRPGRRLQHDGQDLALDLQMIVPTAVDWDADGDTDLVVGDEDGRVALVEHTGRVEDGLPAFLPPKYFRQQADLVKFGALVTPVSVDWDGDGDEDLVCGNTAGYVGFLENLDGGDPPQWAAPQLLNAGDDVLRIQAGPNGSIQGPAEAKWGYTTLSAADWDHDGRIDLVVNSIWGRVVWYRNMGTRTEPRLAAARDVEVQWPGKPPKPAWNWWDPAPLQLATQWRTTPVVIDLNRDGLNDLVMLDHEGYLSFFRREQRGDQLVLLPGERIFTDTKGQPLQLNSRDAGGSGRRKLCFADWDGDGRLDLLVNSINADLYHNVSTDDRPWSFRHEGPVHSRRLAGHTTSPTVVDYNRDGRPDLALGAEDGHLYYLTNKPTPPARMESKAVTVEGRHFQPAVLDNGQTAFANRTYVWIEVPEDLRGWRYTKTYGGEPAFIRVTAREDTILHLATAPGQQGAQSTGWKKADQWTFRYTDRGRTSLQVYTRAVKAGEEVTLPQGNWTGSLLLIPPDVD